MSNFLDLVDNGAPPSVSNASTTRLARIAGLLQASSDGGAFAPLAAGLQASEAVLAQQLLGVGAQGLLSAFHLTAAQLQAAATLFATGTTSATASAGFYRLATGALAAQTMNIVAAAPGRSSLARTGQPWYVSARFAASTAVTAQTLIAAGLYDTSNVAQASMGVNGSVSASFFTLVGGAGGNITTTVAVDTAMHTHRAWRVGGVTFYSVDGVVFTGASDLSQPSSPAWNLANGTDAIVRQLDAIWLSASAQSL
jgi:hypothetical protein